MKIKTLIAATALSAFAVACSDGNRSTSDAQATLTEGETETVDPVFAERDSLIALFNDISGDMIQLKQVEQVVSVPGNLSGDCPQTPQLRDDIAAIRQTLEDRRQRLAELESKLKSSSTQNKNLLAMIDNLKAQMEQNEATIASLTSQLEAANRTIAGLNTQVDSLNNSVAAVSAEKAAADARNQVLTDDLNRCFYVLGSKSELKDHKIIETGFLRKTKIMQGDYETSYFTKADRRTLTQIPLYSKKAKVLTNQPADSYTISTDSKGLKTLEITNPGRFWGASNYLVVQTD